MKTGPRCQGPLASLPMFQNASERGFDLVLFWSLDRLSREGASQTLNYWNRLANHGVGYRSFTELYFDAVLRQLRDLQRCGDRDYGHRCQAGTHPHQRASQGRAASRAKERCAAWTPACPHRQCARQAATC